MLTGGKGELIKFVIIDYTRTIDTHSTYDHERERGQMSSDKWPAV